jgi:hypothetical protein
MFCHYRKYSSNNNSSMTFAAHLSGVDDLIAFDTEGSVGGATRPVKRSESPRKSSRKRE